MNIVSGLNRHAGGWPAGLRCGDEQRGDDHRGFGFDIDHCAGPAGYFGIANVYHLRLAELHSAFKAGPVGISVAAQAVLRSLLHDPM